MKEHVFRSPGFFEREVDLTQREKTIEGVPAGVIGTAQKGPAFVPVTVGSFLDFEQKFGSLNPEFFGPYAVDAFLQHRTALTYIRVLGAGANSTVTDINATEAKGTVKNAGFKLVGQTALAVGAPERKGRHVGTVQFIAATHNVATNYESVGYPIFTDNESLAISPGGDVNLIRAMVLLASGARMEVLSSSANYPAAGTTSGDSVALRGYDGTEEAGTFNLILSSALGSSFANDEGLPSIKIYTASLDPNSKHYVGKILNTSVDRFHEEQHYLYADFAVESEIAKVKQNANASVAILSGSDNNIANDGVTPNSRTGVSLDSGDINLPFRKAFGSFNTRYQTAKTTAFISQPFGDKEYDLFHFEALDDGEAGNMNVKVSISNLRRSTNPKDPYGTFTVLVRDYSDSDTNLKILEQYSLCSLNPADENYVANKIGDMKVFYNFDAESESERRVNVEGKRPNKSAYVRIIMNQSVENSIIPKETLPFGFRGLPLLKTTDSLTDGTTTFAGLTHNRTRLGRVLTGISENQDLSYAILPPVPLRFKASKGAVSTTPGFTGSPGKLELADSRYFWGIKFERLAKESTLTNSALYSNASSLRNPLIDSYSKMLGIKKLDTLTTGSGADKFNNNKFTLARVALNNLADETTVLDTALKSILTGSAAQHMREAAYLRDGYLKTPNYTINDNDTFANRLTFGSLAAANSATYFNRFTDYLKFTNMLAGGFDGLNILDKDQRLMNDKSACVDTGGKAAGTAIAYQNLSVESSPGSGVDNNIISSYRTAGRILTDPLASRVNIIAVPGIRDTFVTDYISDLTRDYSKAIYIMDMPAYDDQQARLYDDATSRPNVRITVEQFEGRALDNNYTATYFPDVMKDDRINRETVNMPASIAAIGALAYNDSVAYPWFAPAGFNRAALGDVVNTEIRLNAEDRNILYEARINPIANFPNGGFVIFGQKTLQQARSALDRVNVRRMLLEVKRIVANVANKIIFEQNTPSTRARFVSQVTPLLSTIQFQQGIDQFKIVMDSSNNSQEDIEQNRLNGRIILVPTRAVEFIAIDFIITNAGVSFE